MMKTVAFTLTLQIAFNFPIVGADRHERIIQQSTVEEMWQESTMITAGRDLEKFHLLQAFDDHDAKSPEERIRAITVDHADEDHHDMDDQAEEFSRLLASNESVSAKPWGAALLAAFLVNLCTLIGIVFVVPASWLMRTASKKTKDYLFHIMIPSFACGSLLATAVFLLIPESMHLLSGEADAHDDHRILVDAEEEEETEETWKFGVSLLAGYFLPYIFAGFFPHSHVPEALDDEKSVDGKGVSGEVFDDVEKVSETDIQNKAFAVKDNVETESTAAEGDESLESFETQSPDWILASSVLAGDFFHNFADGIFIGTSFLLCTRDIAIIVTATTVFHELSQELADFFLFTIQCRIPTWKALALNFTSGFSVMLGVIVIFATDVSNIAVGVILAMSAGVYLYVALTECAPRVNKYITDRPRRAISFLFWIVGAVPIGLVLLNHSHCE